MNSAEFAALIRKRGYTKEYVIQLIEARDREVRASALREAADMVAKDQGDTLAVVIDLRDMADRTERGES